MSLHPAVYQQLDIDEATLVKAFHHDVQEIFATMVGIEDLLHLPLLTDPRTHFSDCMTAMVGFAGLFTGLLSLHLPCSLALTFTSSMLGMEVTELNEDVNDAIGEIANMIAGSFKHHLSRDGHEVRLSTPSVIHGKEYAITSGAQDDTLCLLFDAGGDWFMISIVIETE
jgi:chemotaxis protein CheX